MRLSRVWFAELFEGLTGRKTTAYHGPGRLQPVRSRLYPGRACALRVVRIAACSLIIIAWAAELSVIARRPKDYQWDFAPYYYAALAERRGLDPYRLQTLQSLWRNNHDIRPALTAGRWALPFAYPPIVLHLLSPLARLPFSAARLVWFWLKCAVLVALLALWWLGFLRKTDGLLFLAVAFLGFNGALMYDMKAGNKAILEELALWLGLLFYLRDRRWAAMAAIVAAAIFDLAPILFLGVLLVRPEDRRRNLPVVAAGVCALAALVLLPALPHPGWLAEYRQVVAATAPRQFIGADPSFLSLISYLFASTGHAAGGISRTAALGIWAFFDLAVVLVSLPALRRVARSRDRVATVMGFAVMYALMMPRLMDYSISVLIPPAVLALQSLDVAPVVLAALLVIHPTEMSAAVPASLQYLLSQYYAWGLMLLLWLYWLYRPLCWQREATRTEITGARATAEEDPAEAPNHARVKR